MTSRVDKRMLFGSLNVNTGNDTNWDSTGGVVTLFDNSSGEVNITIQQVDAEISVKPGTSHKYYYLMIFVTDPGGNVPAGTDGISFSSINTYLTTYRRQIWMNAGGIALAGQDDELVRLVPFNAQTKRTLLPGQKLVLIAMCANTGPVADQCTFVYDINLFYDY